jgi:hypothetical protein
VTYNPPAGTVLNIGTNQTLTVSVAATTDYSAASATTTINVLFNPISISGKVFNDLNGNGGFDNGEAGLANVIIKLDGQAAATTDTNGNYTLTGVGPGSHTLTEAVSTGYLQTSPAGDAFTVVPVNGVNISGDNFSNQVPTVSMDNGQAGYAELGGGWQTYNTGWNGNSRVHTADSTGKSTATWTMTVKGGIPKGNYKVYVSFPSSAGISWATNAPYTIKDGITFLNGGKPVFVDQSKPAFGGTMGGVGWYSLGTFTFSSGKAVIVLNASANGTVDADGVLLVPAGSAQYLDVTAVTGETDGQAVPLTLEQLQPLEQEAKALWQATGLTAEQLAALAHTNIYISPLTGGLLGYTAGTNVWIDPTAEGRGWFLDARPTDPAVFVSQANGQWQALPGSPAYGRVDLLTVMAHELGHVLGLPDVPNAADPGNLMDERLAPGIRRLPEPSLTRSAVSLPLLVQPKSFEPSLSRSASSPSPLATRGISTLNPAVLTRPSDASSFSALDQVLGQPSLGLIAPARGTEDRVGPHHTRPNLEAVIDDTALARLLDRKHARPASTPTALDPADAAYDNRVF